MKKLRVLLVAGGSGGHIYPLVAVARSLKEQTVAKGIDVDLRFFGSPLSFADYLKSEGIRVSKIVSSKLRRYISIQNFFDIFKFFWGFIQAIVKIYFFMPDVVFSKSGPGVLPVIYASRWYRIPVVIHESDVVPGLTNRLSARKAKVIELSFEKTKETYFKKYLKKKKKIVNVVGNPVRENILTQKNRAASRRTLGLDDKKPILFFIGGSQGSQAINYFVLENGEKLLSNYEIIHQVGIDNYEGFKGEYEFMSKNYDPALKKNYKLFSFLDDSQMADALNAADLIISRSGGSIFELAASKKPVILIPLPTSANNHQYENAYAYQEAGAGIVLEEENLLINIFLTQVQNTLNNKELIEKMRAGADRFYKPDADEDIARDIITTANVKSKS